MLYVAENTQNEEFVHTKGRAIVNRLVGIHSNATETQIPTQAIRIAVDGKGDIYSVYALGDGYGGFSQITTARGGGLFLVALAGAPLLASLSPHRTSCLATSRFPALSSLAI